LAFLFLEFEAIQIE